MRFLRRGGARRRRDELPGEPAVPPSLEPLPTPALSVPAAQGVIFTPCTHPGSHRPRVAPCCVRRYSSPSPRRRPAYRGTLGPVTAVSGPIRTHRGRLWSGRRLG